MALSLAQAQTLLDALGYKPGNRKGVFDEATKKAIQRFQLDEYLLPTGVVDTLTEETLVTRAKEKGVDGTMPWYVWVGILVGVPLVAYGVYHLILKKEEERVKAPRYVGFGGRARSGWLDHDVDLYNRFARNPLSPSALEVMRTRYLPPSEREPAPIALEAPTTVPEPIPATVLDPQIMLPGSRRPSISDRIKLDEAAQIEAYNKWAPRMEVLGKSEDTFMSDYAHNLAALQARHQMDDPTATSDEIYNRAAAELIRTDVGRQDSAAQARFKRYTDIERRKMLRAEEERKATLARMSAERNRRIQDEDIAGAPTMVDTLRPRRVTMSEVLDVAGEAERRAKKIASKKDPRYDDVYQNEMRRVIEERKGR